MCNDGDEIVPEKNAGETKACASEFERLYFLSCRHDVIGGYSIGGLLKGDTANKAAPVIQPQMRPLGLTHLSLVLCPVRIFRLRAEFPLGDLAILGRVKGFKGDQNPIVLTLALVLS